MFADDAVLIQSNPNSETASQNLRQDMITISNYFRQLKLLLNTKKTKVMNFTKYWRKGNTQNFPKIIIDNCEIEEVEDFNYLGITIDKELNFRQHLYKCIKKSNSKLYMLNKIKDYLPIQGALALYKSMVLPYLEYGNIFLLNCSEGDKIKIQRAQNRGLKCVLQKDRRFDTKILHREARLATWEVRARLAGSRLMFKYKHYPEYLQVSRLSDATQGSQLQAPNMLTRASAGPILAVEYPRSNKFLNSTSYRLRREWNELPRNLRQIDDYEHFKLSLKRYYREEFERDDSPQ